MNTSFDTATIFLLCLHIIIDKKMWVELFKLWDQLWSLSPHDTYTL